MRYPFEATVEELTQHVDVFVDVVFSSLESEFLVMPKGKGFVEYPDFEGAYEDLKRGTDAFHNLRPEAVTAVADRNPRALLVLRAMLGFTPSEWAYATARHSGIDVSQGFARALDRRIRLRAGTLSHNQEARRRIGALVETACFMLANGPDSVPPDKLHRLQKADTHSGQESLLTVSALGVPYAMLLYERFLGRPFAGHRDSVSEIVGDALTALLDYMESHPQVGVAGPQLRYADGRLQPSRRRFPTPATLFVESTVLQQLFPRAGLLRGFYVADIPDDTMQDVDWLVGACLLVRRAAIAQVGLLDERFFMYSEETDWCLRMRRAGWRVVYLPAARVTHHEARSSEQNLARRNIAFNESKCLYAAKHFGPALALVLRVFILATFVYQYCEESAKLVVGHKRDLRRGRLAMLRQVISWQARHLVEVRT